jgi:transposase-like protein
VDFYLSKKRDYIAAKRFLIKAIESQGLPEKANIDKSGANLAALKSINRRLPKEKKILIRQVRYLNNIVEQDHRAIKRMTRPMMGFKSFDSASATLTGIELCHKLRKGQSTFDNRLSPAEQFYKLAAQYDLACFKVSNSAVTQIFATQRWIICTRIIKMCFLGC